MTAFIIVILVLGAAFVMLKMKQYDKNIPSSNAESSNSTVASDASAAAEGTKPVVDYSQPVLIDFSEDEPMRGREKKVKPGKGENGSFYAKIAGITFNCSPSDAGVIRGTVRPEPTNNFDPEAMAIVNEVGKTLGYIGAYDLLEYRRWCRLQEFPFVGYILYDGYTLSGRILAINPENYAKRQRIEKEFLLAIEANLGLKE